MVIESLAKSVGLVIGIALGAAPIKGRTIIGCECLAASNTLWQVRIGDEISPEGYGISVAILNSLRSTFCCEVACCDEHAIPVLPKHLTSRWNMLMVDFALARTRRSWLDQMQVNKAQAIEFLN